MMKVVRNLVGISVVFVSFLLVACGGSDNKGGICGDSKSSSQENLITNYTARLVRYDKPIDAGFVELPKLIANNEVVQWNTFSLELNASYQTYFVKIAPRVQFSLFTQAAACSLAPPSGKQLLTKASITSANDYSDKHPAGSELISLFASVNHGATNLAVLGINGRAPLEFKLNLLEAPQYARQNFEVQITLDDGSVFIMKTGDVYFTLP